MMFYQTQNNDRTDKEKVQYCKLMNKGEWLVLRCINFVLLIQYC